MENPGAAKNETQIASAPWKLTGSGYILLYRFTNEFIAKQGFLSAFQQEHFKRGWGAVMLVDYKHSPVGPYQELLFIPGLFSFDRKNVFSISKIYVSTQLSVVNGIENWGIPKEKADFQWTKELRQERIEISKNGVSFFKVEFRKKGFRFLVSTAILPLKIVQAHRQGLMLTQPKSNGMACLAKMQSLDVNGELFPDLSKVKPLLALHVKNFEMEFPVATLISPYKEKS